MILPSTLKNQREWTFVGPLGPEVPTSLLSYPVLGVDGGAHHTDHLDVWVGDSDSLKRTLECPSQFHHPTDKAQSDLALAFSLFKDPLYYKFHLWGFLGGRKDHELFNLGEAMSFLETHPEAHVIFYEQDGKESFHLLGSGLWKFHHIGLFSLGTLKTAQVKLTGECKYHIPSFRNIFPLSSFGLSNSASGEVLLENEGPLFVYFPEGR